jgi:hypothetical protein
LSLSLFISWLSTGVIVVAGLSGLLRFRHLPTSLRYLAALTIFELPMDMLGFVLMLARRNNLFLMPIYTIGELTLLGLLYKHTLRSAAFSRALPWIIGSFVLYVAFDSLLGPGVQWFRPAQQVVESLLVLGMVGLYFRKLLSELRINSLEREPMFWVSTGLVLYFLGYLQIALFSNYLLHHYSAQFNRHVWAVQTLLAIVLQSCYSLALWIRPQK